jgi:hypothetical protein
MNGLAAEVATASQPVITFPAAEKAIVPETDAVAVIVAGSKPNVALPPDRTSVGASACADDIPSVANVAIATLAIIFFI